MQPYEYENQNKIADLNDLNSIAITEINITDYANSSDLVHIKAGQPIKIDLSKINASRINTEEKFKGFTNHCILAILLNNWCAAIKKAFNESNLKLEDIKFTSILAGAHTGHAIVTGEIDRGAGFCDDNEDNMYYPDDPDDGDYEYLGDSDTEPVCFLLQVDDYDKSKWKDVLDIAQTKAILKIYNMHEARCPLILSDWQQVKGTLSSIGRKQFIDLLEYWAPEDED